MIEVIDAERCTACDICVNVATGDHHPASREEVAEPAGGKGHSTRSRRIAGGQLGAGSLRTIDHVRE
ncbi:MULTISPECIES: hypothetical protein [Bradyrhizobium]|jgi:NAD-dependent dihydropyrimidine dehydrogenase PreA subunit|uniref:hypothetical protein n=1 Tax=Bradyrhizobium elkanii TaxID=29448 RepID=UPI00041FB883|nr:hypothetical protein [Bradyrhizobium elkanii]